MSLEGGGGGINQISLESYMHIDIILLIELMKVET